MQYESCRIAVSRLVFHPKESRTFTENKGVGVSGPSQLRTRCDVIRSVHNRLAKTTVVAVLIREECAPIRIEQQDLFAVELLIAG